MSPCFHGGIQVGGLFANGLKQLWFEPYVDTMGERKFYTIVITLNLALFACFSPHFMLIFVFYVLNWSANSKVPKIL